MPNLAQMILLCLRQRCSPQTTILCSLWTPEKLPVQPKAEQSLGSPETVQLQAMVMLKEYHDLQYQMLVPQKNLPTWLGPIKCTLVWRNRNKVIASQASHPFPESNLEYEVSESSQIAAGMHLIPVLQQSSSFYFIFPPCSSPNNLI